MEERQGLTAVLGDLVRTDRSLAGLLAVEDLDQVLDDGILRSIARGHDVPGTGPAASSVFLVLYGQLREYGEDGESTLGPGDLIGTAGLLEWTEWPVTATAESASILVQIPREVAGRVFERVPRLMQRLFERNRRSIVARTLAAAPVFASVDPDALAALADVANLAGHREGSDIVHTGDPGDTFHVIADGIAAVRHHVGGRPINLALARAGDYFGEWSLLTGAPRAATVTALTRTITVGLDREVFLDLVQQHPGVQQKIDLEAHNRHDRSRAFLARVESGDDVKGTLQAIEAIISERP